MVDNKKLIEALEDFVYFSTRLASYAQSQWADNHSISQDCHWLNVCRVQALAALADAEGEPNE